jgi:hypothetical protein
MRQALSKLVEYPGGGAEKLASLLDDAVGVDPAGRDYMGLTALHKFASWDKPELLDVLLPRLDEDAVSDQE